MVGLTLFLLWGKKHVRRIREKYGEELQGKTLFSPSETTVLKKVIWISEKEGAALFGKTGSGLREERRFIPEDPEDTYVRGWFVGYVEKEGNTYYVAALSEGEAQAYGGKAREVTLQILKDKGLY